jgi:hypothetical protein
MSSNICETSKTSGTILIQKYPALTKFVKDNIIPDGLENMQTVLELYIVQLYNFILYKSDNNDKWEDVLYSNYAISPIIYHFKDNHPFYWEEYILNVSEEDLEEFL